MTDAQRKAILEEMSKLRQYEECERIPVVDANGNLENFVLRIAGKPYRCICGCNVFHKPDRNNLDLYECNACEERFEAE